MTNASSRVGHVVLFCVHMCVQLRPVIKDDSIMLQAVFKVCLKYTSTQKRVCDGGWTVCCACGAHTTPIPSQRARAWSTGKTPSFSFCQVDMYAYVLVEIRLAI